MSAQVHRFGHGRSGPGESKMQDAGDLEQCGQFHKFLSARADRAKKRQNNLANEWGMKQPESRRCDANDGENPAAQTATQPQPPTGPGPFKQETASLEEKISGRQTVTAAGRQRDDHFMDQT